MRRWPAICFLILGAAIGASGSVRGQRPTPGGISAGSSTGSAAGTATAPRQDGPTQNGESSADVHSEARSREMFTSCDGDSDDRLDLFEACEALETLGDPRDSSAFQRLDRDRDGYLTWPEFDLHFRSIVQRGNTFRVKTCRRLVPQAPEQQQAVPLTPMQRFVQTYDKNGNGGLDPNEIDDLIKVIQLPPVIGTGMKALDMDFSGRVEESELAPFFDRLRGTIAIPGLELPKSATALPPAWAPIDANADGVIDIGELKNALRHLDPTLARWAELLLKQLDRDKNGTLDAAELPGGPTAGTAAPRVPAKS